MNINVATQNNGILAHAAAIAAERPIDLRQHNNFGITFQVIAAIAADAVFEIQAAPASDADPCVPGTWHDVQEVVSCDWATAGPPASQSQVTIPASTPIGSICTATLPCKPDAFIRVRSSSGTTASVIVVVVLGGPR